MQGNDCCIKGEQFEVALPNKTHRDFGHNMIDQEWKKKAVGYIAKLNKQQTLFKKQSSIHSTALEAIFIVAYQILRCNKSFSSGELIKQCLIDGASVVCFHHTFIPCFLV